MAISVSEAAQRRCRRIRGLDGGSPGLPPRAQMPHMSQRPGCGRR